MKTVFCDDGTFSLVEAETFFFWQLINRDADKWCLVIYEWIKDLKLFFSLHNDDSEREFGFICINVLLLRFEYLINILFFFPPEFFRELLENSKRDFHDMFKRTYGILYEQNSEVFTDLFRDLEDYYARGKLDLEEAMDHFFTALYQRMFTVLNAQFRFDDKYIKTTALLYYRP